MALNPNDPRLKEYPYMYTHYKGDTQEGEPLRIATQQPITKKMMEVNRKKLERVHTTNNLYTPKRYEFGRGVYKSHSFEELLMMATALSNGIKFVLVD